MAESVVLEQKEGPKRVQNVKNVPTLGSWQPNLDGAESSEIAPLLITFSTVSHLLRNLPTPVSQRLKVAIPAQKVQKVAPKVAKVAHF